jgi:hypothetical protein
MSIKEALSHYIEKFYSLYNPHFFLTKEGVACVRVSREDAKTCFKIGKKSCIDFVNSTLRKLSPGGGHQNGLNERIQSEFTSLAQESGYRELLWLRVGKKESAIYVDLLNENKFVEILPGKEFSITTNPDMNFWAPSKSLPLPFPIKVEQNWFLSEWDRLFGFRESDGSYLLLAFIIKALIPNSGANPILIIEGMQGSGKTTKTQMIKRLIDPSSPDLLGTPKNEESILASAVSSYLLVYDNLSWISSDNADVFCRLSTGGGLVKRKLYTDDDEINYDVSRPVIFNGIEELSERADFLDRALVLHATTIPSKDRKSEADIWNEYERIQPQLLGGLYSLVSQVLERLPGVRTSNLPRMTEFARVGLALDMVLGKPSNHFVTLLDTIDTEKVQNLFFSDSFCVRLQSRLNRDGEELIGTAEELRNKICGRLGVDDLSSRHLPSSPRAFKAKLERCRHVLSKNGITFGELDRTATSRRMFIRDSKQIPETDSMRSDFYGDLLLE